MNLVMGKHGVEEVGEGRDQAGPQGVDEELDLSGYSVDRSSGRRPGHRLSPFIEAGSKRKVDLIHGLLIEHSRSADDGLDGRS